MFTRRRSREVLPFVFCLGFALSDGFAADPCAPVRTFADGLKPTREIFVATTGDNNSGTGAAEKPFRSLARALQGVRAGDAIRLLPGTYSAGTAIQNVAGQSNAPIWIGGVAGKARPLISGGSEAIHLTRVRYLVLENLEVAGSTSNGINCDDGGDYANPEASRYLVFRGLHIHNTGTGGNNDGLKLSGLNDYFVIDCAFESMSAGGSAIDHVGCHRGVIMGCTFTNSGANSIQCKGGSVDIEIRGNRFVNGGPRAVNIGGSTGLTLFRPPLSTSSPNVEARDIRVIANLFRGSEAPVAFVGATDCRVANNTFIEPTKWVMRILQETVSSGAYTFSPCGRNQFVNNLVHYDRSRVSIAANVGPNTDAASFQFANNLWYAFNDPARSKPSLPAVESAGIYGANPLFKDAAAGDFSVRTNSPAVAKGLKTPEPGLDLAGRCFAVDPTVGAFEARPRPGGSADLDTDGDGLPDGWEEAHGFDRLDPSDAQADTDGDLVDNLGEFIAGTNPRLVASVPTIRAGRGPDGSVVVRHETVPGRLYRVQRRGLAEGIPWADMMEVAGDGHEATHTVPEPHGDASLLRLRIELGP